jgi:hypothetical protein
MTKRVFDKERFDMWDIDGQSIESVIEHFQYEVDRLKDIHEGSSDFSFSFDTGWSGDSVEAYIHYMRDETSSETAKRLKEEEKAKAKKKAVAAKKEAKERKEFERLKKKFG